MSTGEPSEHSLPIPIHHDVVSGTYNISVNLSAIGSTLLSIPTRLLAKIRKVDDMIAEDTPIAEAVTWTSTAAAASKPSISLTAQSFPGPWAFFTSAYMLGLFAMAVLMHRIQNIVVPTRFPNASQLNSQRRRRVSLRRRLYNALLPMDVSRTSTRLALHMPSLYYMCKMLLMWTLLLLKSADLCPEYESGTMHDLLRWSEQREMNQIAWSTFCAVCAAFCVEGFVKGLDGVGVGIGAHMQANSSPFNLVGYAFLLHIYSSPITHVNKPEGLPSRPDKHVVFTIAIPLLQLTVFHILSIRKQWSTHRLIPTALTSILSLIHFHITLLMHSYSSLPLHSSDKDIPSSYSSPNGTANYPLLNYIPNLFETMLLITIVLTISLNCLTQLVLTGSITRPLLGLGLAGRSTSAWSWSPNWDEDFGVLILRVGTASLEATGMRGWGNEMGTVVAPKRTVPVHAEIEYGTVAMSRSGAITVIPGSVAVPPSGRNRNKRRTMWGWKNEIRMVHVREEEAPSGGSVGIPGIIGVSRLWLREAWRYVKGVCSVGGTAFKMFWDIIRGRKVRNVWMAPPPSRLEIMNDRGVHDLVEDLGGGDDLYDRFVKGDELSDDDDDDEWDNEDAASASSDEEDEDEEDEEKDREALALYADLRAKESTPGVSSTTLLAHMTHTGGSPLTRRRYGALLDGEKSAHYGSVVDADLSPGSSSTAKSDDLLSYDDPRQNCVICTTEVREIICWPCRCLSMCDNCRESLASRSSSSKHRCPCCRRNVEGYSRIFIP
ncbi:uncharacterized protein BT62DRAFT_766865 [Guyanagaster necrorhizus]|uniref:RING-type domain-containing protein n=1 Tax=Guyanagaster necrorhizus TaxID=856835 RepID=A0A9P8AUL1_9AGAR|nr:uncharacterized protein BT62DRAFT_766865 [Guyanagaster necrorhizus MCA 3950]KAG7448355.1 hypothetical protein BT62DRAFT_766865 [Guyanagaster necrorhizus MCA 3950]